MNKQAVDINIPALIAVITLLLTSISCFVGYVLNIYMLICHHNPFTTLEILRCVGVLFPPLGVIFGYFF